LNRIALKIQKIDDPTMSNKQQPLLNLSFCQQAQVEPSGDGSSRLTPMDMTMPPPATKKVFNESGEHVMF
jgi:hypothetical protein